MQVCKIIVTVQELEDFYQDEVDRFHADLDASHEDHSSDEELADEVNFCHLFYSAEFLSSF